VSVLITASGVKPGVTGEELRAAFAGDGIRGNCLVLESDDGSALQALGEGFGPYTLEHFPAPRTGTHTRACEELKRQEVLEAMVDFLGGGSAWRDAYLWREVEDEKRGIAAELAALAAVVSWALVGVGGLLLLHAASRAVFHQPVQGTVLWGVAGLTCLAAGVAYVARRRGAARRVG